jgi:ribosome maturation factor RimP
MPRSAQLQDQVETMLRDAVPDAVVLLAELPTPGLLRVTIDRTEGAVDIDLCERVSRQLSPLRERYALEVSSPGIERPLVTPEHFRRFIGHEVAVRTEQPLDGRRSFRGRLTDAQDEMIQIDQEGEAVAIPMAAIRRAHLVVEGLGGTS